MSQAEVSECPGKSVLESWLLGQTQPEAAEALDRHIFDCERCCHVLEEVDSCGPSAAEFPASEIQSASVDGSIAAVMARLKEVTLPARDTEETAAYGSERTEDAWELEKLLDPPQADGELGRFGPYRVLRVLGAGGMGQVFDAEDVLLRRRVALKVMKPSLARHEDHRQRFLREARAAAAIEHAHIVTVYQVGEHRGLPFLAMQLLKGEALDERLRRDTRLPVAECLRIGRETAEALAEAHSRNLIHRDIKPGNIWLESPHGWVKLVDFGLAHAADDVHLTQTGAILGTPAYMSPEQARGETVDARSDLYSLGAVLFRLATGEIPVRGASTMALLIALATETPRQAKEINPAVPRALNDVIARLLAKKPDERFESAAAVAEAIRAIEDASLKSEVQSPKSENGAGRRGARWPFVLATAAAAFIAAAIVIIVRDKDGKELARISVDGGVSAEVRTDAAASNVAPALGDGSASRSPTGDGSSPPSRRVGIGATLPEPPPLKEWLKGRTVLTVAQDGSGQFKTIQAALDALQSGEVVSVLDRGPYRERLTLGTVPPDTGLISAQGTVLELSEWTLYLNVVYQGHSFFGIDGFRLHGFDMHFSDRMQGERGWCLNLQLIGNLVIEHCRFRTAPHKLHHTEELALDCPPDMVANNLVWIRHCLIEGFMDFAARGKAETSAVLEQNLFTSGEDGPRVNLHDTAWQTVVVRNNLFTGQSVSDVMLYRPWKSSSVLEVTNNTTATTLVELVSFPSAAGDGTVVVRNNLRTAPKLLGIYKGTPPATLPSNWQVDHNVYPDIPPGQSWMLEGLMPRSDTDVTDIPRFLSKNPTNADYLRIAADGPFANAGAGGAWPTYVGALPPGPAPKEGDWFTRLRNWHAPVVESASRKEADVAPPAQITEPPPLEEWLKGRTVLTVAQDGSGKFKTIQAALDALQPGQAVEVLDRGPYRETLRLVKPPRDVGLFSRHQTVIELTEWKVEPLIVSEFLQGHSFLDVHGFRLSGFRLNYQKQEKGQGATYWRWPIDLLIEDCAAYAAPSSGDNHVTVAVCATLKGYAGAKPMVVRDCVFVAGGVQPAGEEPGSAVFLRNYFRDSAIHTVLGFDELVIRNNVFDENRTAYPILINNMIASPRVLEIANNTLFGDVPGAFTVHAPQQGVLVRNNILLEGILFVSDVPAEEREHALRGWKFDHNGSLRDKSDLRSATDVLGDPEVLSTDPQSRDYLRVRAEGAWATGGAGGDWPSYLGALPPGPAPHEGDWFTRLRDRWLKIDPVPARRDDGSAVPSPKGDGSPPPQSVGDTVPQPPPLEEWLKDRTVLTVSQDGNGQFKTIQAALDALRPGQAVEVLDRGPYREPIFYGRDGLSIKRF